jgi:plasmid stabilization system protein ParE
MAGPYSVIVAPEALVEVVHIAAWWTENRPRAPRLFQNELDKALVLIACHPQIGNAARSRRVGNARVVELPRSRHRVYYQVRDETRQVLIVHVRHGRRQPLRAGRR